jgi:uncharacterized membrane protein SpoIIM required for sporulation
MPSARRPGAPFALYQHHEIETPENVVLDYEIAGIGSRVLAAFLDLLILFGWYLGAGILLQVIGLTQLFGSWLQAVYILIAVLAYWGYFTLFEALRFGQTPGKRHVGIRVVRDTGHPINLGAAAARGLLRAIDLFPPLLLVDALLIAFHPRARRLGDLVAGTIVVRDRPVETAMPDLPADLVEDTGAPELDDAEFRVLREYVERSARFTPELRERFADRLAERFAPRFPARSGQPVAFLAWLYQLELSRRRGRYATSRRGAAAVAERLIARKSARWEEFRVLAERAGKRGLDSLEPEELPDFAARYREIAADLARARTYRAPPVTRHLLERLVAAGHNALYRDERKTAARVWEMVMRECPAAVLRGWRYVLVAIVTFSAPIAAGYLLMRERPALAQEVLPDGMLRRAEAGVERQARGEGYYVADPRMQAAEASFIISNNVRVAFFCFAGGVLLGIGALVLLAFNGLSIGTTFGHFANLGLFGYIGTFVLGHGTLELFAICVAGAAGFLLGKSIIAPGMLSRGDALVLNGRLALRMIGAVVVMLAVAGTIEGFVSTGTGGVTYRMALGGASVLFLLLYLMNGASFLRRGGGQPGAAGRARTRPA